MFTQAYPSSVSAGLRMIADSINGWGHFQEDVGQDKVFVSPDEPGPCCLLYNPIFQGRLAPQSMTTAIQRAMQNHFGTPNLILYNDTHPTEEIIKGLHELADKLEEKNG
jgi:hypothetical protein